MHPFPNAASHLSKLFQPVASAYTVPKYIRPEAMADKVTVRFRVGQIYKNCGIATYFGKERISFRKRPVMAPGEMESVVLTKEQLTNCPDLEQITICIEEA